MSLRQLEILKQLALRFGKHLGKPKDLKGLRKWEMLKLGQGSRGGQFWFILNSGDDQATLIVTSDPKKEPSKDYIGWATPNNKEHQKTILTGTFKFDPSDFTYEFTTSSNTKEACSHLLEKRLDEISLGFWRALSASRPFAIRLNGRPLTGRKLNDIHWTAAEYDMSRKLVDAGLKLTTLKLSDTLPLKIVLSGRIANKAESNSLTQQIFLDPISEVMTKEVAELIKVLSTLDGKAAKLAKENKLVASKSKLEEQMAAAVKKWSESYVRSAENAVQEAWIQYALEDYDRSDYIIDAVVSFTKKTVSLGVGVGGMVGSIVTIAATAGTASPGAIMSLIGSAISLLKTTVELGQEIYRVQSSILAAGIDIDQHLKKLEYSNAEALIKAIKSPVPAEAKELLVLKHTLEKIGGKAIEKMTSIKLNSPQAVGKEIADFRAKCTGVRQGAEKLAGQLDRLLEMQEKIEQLAKDSYPGWNSSIEPDQVQGKLGISNAEAAFLSKLLKRHQASAKAIDALLKEIPEEHQRYERAKELAEKFEGRLDQVLAVSKALESQQTTALKLLEITATVGLPLLNFATIDYSDVARVVMTTASTAGEMALGLVDLAIDKGTIEWATKKLKAGSGEEVAVAKECLETAKLATETLYDAQDGLKTLVAQAKDSRVIREGASAVSMTLTTLLTALPKS